MIEKLSTSRVRLLLYSVLGLTLSLSILILPAERTDPASPSPGIVKQASPLEVEFSKGPALPVEASIGEGRPPLGMFQGGGAEAPGLARAAYSMRRSRAGPAPPPSPRGKIGPPAAPAPNEVVIRGREVLKERNGVYAFNSPCYGVSFAPGNVEIATEGAIEGLGEPRLYYSFEEARVGDAVIARGGGSAPVANAAERTISYRHGSVEEKYHLKRRALEQTFVIDSLPPGRGEIAVWGKTLTNLDPPAEGCSGPRLAFTHGGNEVISIEQAVAIDKRGDKVSLDLVYKEGRTGIIVPASWVARAELPITIDPLVGAVVAIRSNMADAYGPFSNRSCTLAYNPVDNNWLVVWSEKVGAAFDSFDVLGQRVGAGGSLVGGVVTIGNAASWDVHPSISHAAGVNRYLVAWRQDSPSDSYIEGRVVNGDGTLFTGMFTVDDRLGIDDYSSTAFDGTNWYVSFSTDPGFPVASNWNIAGRFVSTSGVPGVSADADSEANYASQSFVAFTGGVYLISWVKLTPGGTVHRVYARTMDSAGSFLTPITQVSTGGFDLLAQHVSAGPGKFLVTWNESGQTTIKGRVLDSSLVAETGEFTIEAPGNGPLFNHAAYSTTTGEWLAVYMMGTSGTWEIHARRVGPTGAVSAPIQVTTNGVRDWSPNAAWNSATNDMLIICLSGDSAPFQLLGQRYQMPPSPGAFDPLIAVLANGNLSVGGNPVVRGSNGGMHANGNLSISGNVEVEKDLTATGTLSVSGSAVVGGDMGGGRPAQAVPIIDPEVFRSHADFIFKTDGKVADREGAQLFDGAGGAPFNGWKFIGSSGWEHVNDFPSPPAAYFFETDLKIGDSPGSTAAPVRMTLIVKGSIEISGNPTLQRHLADVGIVSGRDIKIGGSFTPVLPGLFAAHEQILIGSSAILTGSIVAENAENVSGLVSGPALHVGGNLTVTYDGDLDTLLVVGPPAPPTNFSGQAQSTASIKWTWNDVVGERGYRLHDGGHIEMAAVGAGAAETTETGLAENAPILRHLHAFNASGEGAASSGVTRHTRVHDPSAADFTLAVVSSSRIDITVAPPPNPTVGSTGVEIQRSLDNLAWAAIRPYSNVYSHVDTGLASATTYFYRIRFRNGDAVVTAFSSSKSATTLPGPPPAPVITTPSKKTSDNTPTLSGTAVPGVTIRVYVGGLLDGSTASLADGTWIYTLSPKGDGSHSIHAVASNASGDSLPSNSIAIVIDTSVNPPTNVSATARAGAVDVEWTPSPDLDVVGYRIYRSVNGPLGPFTLVNLSGLVTGTKYRDAGLVNCKEYCYKVTAVDNAGN